MCIPTLNYSDATNESILFRLVSCTMHMFSKMKLVTYRCTKLLATVATNTTRPKSKMLNPNRNTNKKRKEKVTHPLSHQKIKKHK